MRNSEFGIQNCESKRSKRDRSVSKPTRSGLPAFSQGEAEGSFPRSADHRSAASCRIVRFSSGKPRPLRRKTCGARIGGRFVKRPYGAGRAWAQIGGRRSVASTDAGRSTRVGSDPLIAPRITHTGSNGGRAARVGAGVLDSPAFSGFQCSGPPRASAPTGEGRALARRWISPSHGACVRRAATAPFRQGGH